MTVVCSPPETLDRRLIEQIGSVDGKEAKTLLPLPRFESEYLDCAVNKLVTILNETWMFQW